MNDLKAEFERHQRDGYLGQPDGQDAYAYLRASSERQVEEGSSFPRQLESVHKAAKRDGLRIPFDLIFFDDGFTGFEFEHRPALIRLRHEAHSRPQANHLVIEDIDRLSRNADWQQGYLLEEFARRQIQIHFYISPGSQLERYVRGYIAQEGMKKDIERMRMGGIYKAMDGRVTAKRPRYGYVKTHPKNTHYVLHPEESKVMRAMYEKLIYEGWTLHKIASWLNDTGVPTRFKTGKWTASTIAQLVKSPVYKGEFYANRHYQVRTDKFNEAGRPRLTNRVRPESDWIKVDVPAIVTPEEWQQARETLRRNAKTSTRNSKKHKWLLQSLCRCQICRDYGLLTVVGSTPRNPIRYYVCGSRSSEKARLADSQCKSPSIRADFLEARVWQEIEKIIYDPEALLSRLRSQQAEERIHHYQQQVDYIESQFRQLQKERDKLEAAFQRDIYTLDEFEAKMRDLRGKVVALESGRAKIQEKLAKSQSFAEQQQIILTGLAKLREELECARQEGRSPAEIPFEVKRRILTLLVDVIWVDTAKREFVIEGEISGSFAFDELDQLSGSEATGGGSGTQFVCVSTRIWPQCGMCPWC